MPSGHTVAAIALDLGTTSIKAGLLDRTGELANLVSCPAPVIAADGGRYESDALAYAAAAEQLLDDCIADAGDCTTLGLCSQRSSFLVWEQSTGQPLTALISWQDNRGLASCIALHAHRNEIRRVSGLPLTQYYFAAKLRVVLQENPGWLPRLLRGELCAGTLDTFLIWRLTGGTHFITDASMAARTQLMDIRQQQWSAQLCNLFDIPTEILPEIMTSAGIGLRLMKPLAIRPGHQKTMAKSLVMDNGLVLQSSVGDQSAALFASVREHQPEALVNLGTGCFVIRCLPDGMSSSDGYLQTLVYQDGNRHAHFAIEGTLNSVAAALAPYPADQCRFEDLAADDIYCIAEPSGLGAPYFASRRFAACLPDPLHGDPGVQFSQSVAHLTQQRIAALLLEAVIFRVARILEDFSRAHAIERVFLSGGLSELKCLQHGIAGCVPFEVHHLRQRESSLHGAALLAAGMEPASQRNSTRIAAAANTALRKKYQGWKLWLDDMLSQAS
ncbi:MAG: FGGY family carbohydrate kinase [Gallionella sp.]